MSDSEEGKKDGVPSWQLKAKVEPAEKKKDEPNTKDQPTEEPSRATVIEQAKKFLEEDEVRNASTDKKIAFLETKGLRSEEIEVLLGIVRNMEASSPAIEVYPISTFSCFANYLKPQEQVQRPPVQRQRQVPPLSPPPQQQQQTIPSPPPIITYPEFLTTPTSPSPLITKTRLLTTLYLFSGLSALLYGTNTYLITPMLASLTTSRLSLAETASSNLEKLIGQLEGMVSEIPVSAHFKDVEEREDVDSEDEDPTEMFHRDFGVQTSLPTSPHPSRPSSPDPNSSSKLDDQTTQLKSLKSSLQGLVEDSASEGHNVTELEGTIGILREYLDGMAYVTPSYGYSSMAGGYNGAGGYGGSKDPDDEISKVKAGIRGVKGVLLSARSFPGGIRR